MFYSRRSEWEGKTVYPAQSYFRGLIKKDEACFAESIRRTGFVCFKKKESSCFWVVQGLTNLKAIDDELLKQWKK